MTSLTITRHGEVRMSQRCIRQTDLEVILAHGTEVGRNRIMLKRQCNAQKRAGIRPAPNFDVLGGSHCWVHRLVPRKSAVTYHVLDESRCMGLDAVHHGRAVRS